MDLDQLAALLGVAPEHTVRRVARIFVNTNELALNTNEPPGRAMRLVKIRFAVWDVHERKS